MQYTYLGNTGVQVSKLCCGTMPLAGDADEATSGARNVEQLEPSLQAGEVDMTHEWSNEISKLSPTPPPATDRSETQPAAI